MIRIQTILFGLVLLLAILAAGVIWYTSTYFEGPGRAGAADIGGPFVLTDQDGHARSDKDFRGRFVLLYFGYTYCPDVCPTTLAEMVDGLDKLGPKQARFVPLFITIDPERDTPAVLKKYLAAFGPRFVGLTGSVADVTRVAHAYRVYFAKHPLAGGYAMDHSSIVYLLGLDGKFVTFYDESVNSDTMVKDLKSRV
jgi:cytochrome oxidase Cu insertion factor (SCO1/SenC/PrrC family)